MFTTLLMGAALAVSGATSQSVDMATVVQNTPNQIVSVDGQPYLLNWNPKAATYEEQNDMTIRKVIHVNGIEVGAVENRAMLPAETKPAVCLKVLSKALGIDSDVATGFGPNGKAVKIKLPELEGSVNVANTFSIRECLTQDMDLGEVHSVIVHTNSIHTGPSTVTVTNGPVLTAFNKGE